MKNLENLGVKELSLKDSKNINGGLLGLIPATALTLGLFMAGYTLGKDYAKM